MGIHITTLRTYVRAMLKAAPKSRLRLLKLKFKVSIKFLGIIIVMGMYVFVIMEVVRPAEIIYDLR